jgi:hypothetical protein
MESYSKGFSAPSASFPGATISIECVRYYEGDTYREGEWRTNVFAEGGGWVAHAGSDNVQDTLEAFVSMLTPFYDGTALWLDDDTGEQLSFWEMVVRTVPENLGPRSQP